MPIRILEGTYDGTQHVAVMVDSTNHRLIGPMFEGYDAAPGEQVAAFLEWFESGRWLRHQDEATAPYLALDQIRDPRTLYPKVLDQVVAWWKKHHVDEHGFLWDPDDCDCGHVHIDDAGRAIRGGACEHPGCHCKEWTPGNPAAALAHDDTQEASA